MDILKNIFDPTPFEQFRFYLPVLIICGILFVGSFFIPLFYKQNYTLKNLIRNFPGRIRLSAILMLIYIGLRYQGLPFFSMNFFFYLIIALFIFFIAKFLIILFKKYPKEKNVSTKKRSVSSRNSEFSKYLPTPKKQKKRKK